MLIAGAMVFNYVITVENIPKTLSAMLKAYELSPLVFLLVVNVLLLILGCFLEGTTIILVILPVLLPTAQALGIDPVHFGVMAVTNIMIGLVTPPYGLLLFMMTKIADVPLRDIVRESMPFLYVMIGALALITLVPGRCSSCRGCWATRADGAADPGRPSRAATNGSMSTVRIAVAGAGLIGLRHIEEIGKSRSARARGDRRRLAEGRGGRAQRPACRCTRRSPSCSRRTSPTA